MATKHSKRILLVDDAEDICVLMAELLSFEGYEVDCASNGYEALEHLRSTTERPDAILLDLMMPVMDGYAFRAQQKRDPALASIPILLMTAGGDIDEKARALEAQGYLKKPFKDLEAVLSSVAKVCGQDAS